MYTAVDGWMDHWMEMDGASHIMAYYIIACHIMVYYILASHIMVHYIIA